MANYKMHLLVCGGTGCRATHSNHLAENLTKELAAHGLEDEAKVVLTGCFGFCEQGPILKVIPDNTFYTRVQPGDAKEIIEEHIIKGRKVGRLLYVNPQNEEKVSDS
ncbi:MAG TPA: (2Fe-2S) ferredoxin domain-containing protein, partial [Bacteroidales bacterium]|nr:(2Fe-2S) ferredoxin domain-containing protein [Bacteroidales bacterium]